MTFHRPPDDAIGYFVVIEPGRDAYQAFYLMGEDRDFGQIVLEEAKAASRLVKSEQVRRPSPHVKSEDQAALGVLCAALVECHHKGSFVGIRKASAAIAKLTGLKFFVVSGVIGEKGTSSEIAALPPVMEDVGGIKLPIPVTTIEQAQRSVKSLPVIQQINQRIARQKGTRH